MLCVIMLSVVMLSVIILGSTYASCHIIAPCVECHTAECRYAECPYDEYLGAILTRKCIWMRHGNRVIRAKVPKAATEAAAASVDEFDTVD
jgi:hypothetical protein